MKIHDAYFVNSWTVQNPTSRESIAELPRCDSLQVSAFPAIGHLGFLLFVEFPILKVEQAATFEFHLFNTIGMEVKSEQPYIDEFVVPNTDPLDEKTAKYRFVKNYQMVFMPVPGNCVMQISLNSKICDHVALPIQLFQRSNEQS